MGERALLTGISTRLRLPSRTPMQPGTGWATTPSCGLPRAASRSIALGDLHRCMGGRTSRNGGKFLRSLAEAEEYIHSHPAEVPGHRPETAEPQFATYMTAVWQQNQFSLTLDQSLVTAMEDEARWMIANNQTDQKTVPDFRKYISSQSLEEIKPGSVRIIG